MSSGLRPDPSTINTGQAPAPSRFLIRLAWVTLGYTVLVILWGAVVRATFSGDGCGAHWPLCDGEIIPSSLTDKKAFEFSHRVTSGLLMPLVLLLMGMTWRRFGWKSPITKASAVAVAFTGIEALIGMKLVLFGLVAYNESIQRAIWMAIHLTNTFILLGALTCAAFWLSGGRLPSLQRQGALPVGLFCGLIGMLFLGISGAVTALGDTLFPAKSLAEGLRQDLDPTSHFLIQLRMLHPTIAVSVGLFVLLMAGLAQHWRPDPLVKRMSRWVIALLLVEMAAGVVNVLLLAPVWMQVVHLALADGLWIALVMLFLSTIAKGVERRDVAEEEEAPLPESEKVPIRETINAYIALTKPRVISLLLFTTITAMFAAANGAPNPWLVIFVTIGGYMSAGAANAINMVIDRDIDGTMARTSTRPTVTRQISSSHALLFAFGLAIGSFTILTWAANLLCALLALAGLVFYVIIYTLLLKRRTWHNIVIGGAAGAFPPLVGWAAVAGQLNPLAWTLFAIIFVWTPVHFWALALLIQDEYKQAGVPMLPVVHGERVTVIQIGMYALLTAVVSVLPLFQREVGMIYIVSALLLNAVLIAMCFQLYLRPNRQQARVVFKYSMVYLAVLFLMVAIDRGVTPRDTKQKEPILTSMSTLSRAILLGDARGRTVAAGMEAAREGREQRNGASF